MKSRLILWLLGCFLVTLFCGLVYLSCQQILRFTANEMVLQMANNITNNLTKTQSSTNLFSNQKVDAVYDSSPFIIIFDGNKKIIATNATAMNKLFQEKPPLGVFDYVDKNSIDIFTWEPVSSFRYATVVQRASYNGSKAYVLVARSLGYTERLENQMLIYAASAWFLGVLSISFVSLIFRKINKK